MPINWLIYIEMYLIHLIPNLRKKPIRKQQAVLCNNYFNRVKFSRQHESLNFTPVVLILFIFYNLQNRFW